MKLDGTNGSLELPGEKLLEISNGISARTRELFGKGPRRAKTYACDNFVFVVLQGVLTDAEETLLSADKVGCVRNARECFEEVTREEMIAVVERAAGLRVLDHMSQILPAADTVVEIFVTDANGNGGNSS
jgi:uncharacterized protein YbcI